MEIRRLTVQVHYHLWSGTNGERRARAIQRFVSISFKFDFQMHELEKKLLVEASADSKIVACRFPLPNLQADKIIGGGIDTVWLYNIKTK